MTTYYPAFIQLEHTSTNENPRESLAETDNIVLAVGRRGWLYCE